MSIYTGVMAGAGIAAIVLMDIIGSKDARAAGAGLMTLFLIAAIGSAWVANILISQRPTR